MGEAEKPEGQFCTHSIGSHQLSGKAVANQIHRHLFEDLGESRQRFRAEGNARSVD